MTPNKIFPNELISLIETHKKWLSDRNSNKKLELIGQVIENISVSEVDFQEAVMVRCNLVNVNFNECNFHGAVFIDSTFEECSFINCYMRKADFRSANIMGVNFLNSVLLKVDMQDAVAVGANFTNCDLGGADFIRADLRESIFENANLEWAAFVNAKMGNTKRYHIRSLSNIRLAGSIDISAKGDGTILIDSREELVNYLAITD